MEAGFFNKLSTWQRLLLAVICVLPIIGWTGLLDDLSTDYVDGALASAGIIYGTARGINALVSVLQGTELDAVMLTFTIGELLDPVNDLIERFSGVILIAIGALAVQKILLELVSHTMFNVLLTLLALATGFSLLRNKQALYQLLFRSFVFVAFLRFSLGLVVLANNWVDTEFLAQNDSDRYQAMETFQGELREIGSMAGVNGPSEELTEAARTRMDSLQKARTAEQRNLYRNKIDLEQSRKHLRELSKGRPVWESWISFQKDSPEIAGVKKEVERLEAETQSTSLTIKMLDKKLAEQREALECMEKRARGEACGLLERISAKLSPTEIGARFKALEGRMAEFTDNAIELLMSILLKSVVIPLLFFYLLLKLARKLWDRPRYYRPG